MNGMDADDTGRRQKGFLKRLFHIFKKEKVTRQTLQMMVDAGEQDGAIEAGQKEMIENILEFRDITVEEVMTHRVDIVAAEESDTVQKVIDYALNEGFSRIPVYKEIIDNIVGVIYVKDLLCLLREDEPDKNSILPFIREVLYVPETARCRDLFKQFTEQRRHIAIVVDEYGGTSGIVTLENLLEAIVGEIQDEYDDEADDIQRVNDTTFLIEGTANLEEVAEMLGLSIEIDPDFDTVGGYLINILGRIPQEGEHPVIRCQDVEFTVLVVQERHIAKVRAVKLQPSVAIPPSDPNSHT